MSEKMGTKNIRMTDEMMSACEKYAAEYNAGNANAFVRDAIEFYIEWLNREGTEKFLTPALESVIGSKIALTEDRINQMLFKVAVELAMQNHLTAGRYRYEDDYLDGLRDYCVQEVKALNGRMDLKEIQKAYEG